MTWSTCGRADDGCRATFKVSELEWIEDTREGGDVVCEACAHEMANDA